MSLEKSIRDFIISDLSDRLKKPDIIYTLQGKSIKFDAIPSGISAVDDILSGGLPEGKITEIFGPEASGKTTLTLTFIKNAQKLGYMTYFIDAEHALDVEYAAKIGVNMNELLLSQPEYGEQALETVRSICDSTIDASEKFGKKIKTLIVIDSVPALVPKQAYETYESDKKDGLESSNAMGMTARMLSQNLPPLLNKLNKSFCTVVFINQERDNIGVMYGPTTTTPGGRALKFFASLRLKVSRTGYAEESGEKVGIRTKVVPIKSKQFPIWNKTAEFIIGPSGIDVVAAAIDLAIEREIIKKGGAWLKFNGESYQGRAGLDAEIRKNPALLKSIQDALKPATLKLQPATTQPPVSTTPPVSNTPPAAAVAPAAAPPQTPINANQAASNTNHLPPVAPAAAPPQTPPPQQSTAVAPSPAVVSTVKITTPIVSNKIGQSIIKP
jgi:recombination protein RecA